MVAAKSKRTNKCENHLSECFFSNGSHHLDHDSLTVDGFVHIDFLKIKQNLKSTNTYRIK